MKRSFNIAGRQRYFYGWVIVGVAFLAALSHPAQISSVLGVFVKPMERDLGFTRAAISGVQTLARVIEGGLAPFIGPLIDRGWGKQLMVGGALLAGGGFLLHLTEQEVWQLYLIKGVVVGVGLAGFGALVVNVAVNNWFVAKRGRAIGIASMGASLGSLTMIPLLTWFIATASWRWGWAALGLMIWVTILLPAFLFMVRRPEDVGLLPDGRSPEEEGAGAPPAIEGEEQTSSPEGRVPKELAEESWTRGEALRTRTFWLLTFTLGIAQLAMQAINLHLIPYMEDLGYAASMGALAISARSALQLVGSPLWGIVVERVDPRYLASVKFLMYGLGIYVLMHATSLAAIFTGVLIYGLAMAGSNVITEVMWANYYGRHSLGSVRGMGMPFMIGFSALGPLLAGLVYDVTGSYDGAFLFIIGGAVASSVLILFCTRPKRRVATPHEQGYSPEALP